MSPAQTILAAATLALLGWHALEVAGAVPISFLEGLREGDQFQFADHRFRWDVDLDGDDMIDLSEVSESTDGGASWTAIDQAKYDNCIDWRRLRRFEQEKSYVYKAVDHRELSLYVHYPPGWQPTDSRPAIVWFYGGAWNTGSPMQFRPQADYFSQQRGMVNIRVDYRVKQRDDNVTNGYLSGMDAKSAMRWVRRNAGLLGIDTNQVIAAGGSAGGQMALVTWRDDLNDPNDDLSISARADAFILHNPYVRIQAGTEGAAASVWPVITNSPPPMWFGYGTADTGAYDGGRPDDGIDYIAECQSNGVDVTTYIVPGAGHGFGSSLTYLGPSTDEIDQFLVAKGFLGGSAGTLPSKTFGSMRNDLRSLIAAHDANVVVPDHGDSVNHASLVKKLSTPHVLEGGTAHPELAVHFAYDVDTNTLASGVVVSNLSASAMVSGIWSNAGSRVFTFLPASAYVADNQYLVSVTTNVLDDVGNAQRLAHTEAFLPRPMSADPVLYLPMDTVSGTTTPDESGWGGVVSLSNGVQSSLWGASGGSLGFDGLDDNLTATLATSVPGPGPAFSVSFWLYPRSLANFNQQLGAGSWSNFMFHTGSDGSVWTGVDDINPSFNSRFSSSDLGAGTLAANAWQHMVFTFSNGNAAFYKNGRLLASKSGMDAPIAWSQFRIGLETGDTVDGLVDEVRVYNEALSLSDAEALAFPADTKVRLGLPAGEFAAELATVQALGSLTNAPVMRADDTTMATTNPAAGQITSLYYEGLDYSGSPTRVFAYVGIPAGASAGNPVPAVVLTHGGGGTAFTEWVTEWTNRGYAAISMGLEGQLSAMPGPARVGVYHDSHLELTNQWMYHAVADTVLANSLMRSLPEVDADKVGLTGISWGGVITSTAMGIDDRFAFTIPVYGCGHLYDALNHYQVALATNDLYKQVWDPMVWLANATMPALWFTWPSDFHYPMDCQAYSYHAAPGSHMVSLVPGMGHGHGAGWNRPESYDFADSVLSSGTPWCVQQSLSLVGNTATVVFESSKTLNEATLLYATGTGKTGDLAWPENVADSLVESPPGTWTVTATLPADVTGWFINVKATGSDTNNLYGYVDPNLIASSDYQEIIDVVLTPAGGLDFAHPVADQLSTGTVQVAFSAPTNVEIIDVQINSESHAGAFSSTNTLPWVLWNPSPAVESLSLEFDNSVAGLTDGQSATGMLVIVWEELDGATDQVELPIRATALTPSTVIYDVTTNWSSKTVYGIDDVFIRNSAMVSLDEDDAAGTLTVGDEASPATGALHIDQDQDLTVNGAISLGSGTGAGIVTQSIGMVTAESLTVNAGGTGDTSQYNLSGGAVSLTDDLTVNAGGEVNLTGGILHAGETSPTIVAVNGNGKILVDGGTLGHRYQPSVDSSFQFTGDGLIRLNAGTIEVTGANDGADTVSIHTDMEITGGTLDLDGQIFGNASTDLKVVGDQASIWWERVSGSFSSTVTFEFDEDGVSPINVDYWMFLGAIDIVVDGAAYRGGAGEFILFDSTNFLGLADPNNIMVMGFPGLAASIVQDQTDGLDYLKLVLVSMYGTWTDGYGLGGSDADLTADPEGDGNVNLLEYAHGGSPTSGGDADFLTTGGATSNGRPDCVEFIYLRRRDADDRGLSYTVQATSNLVSAAWTTNNIDEIGTAVLDADFERVTNRIEAVGHAFGRLEVMLGP